MRPITLIVAAVVITWGPGLPAADTPNLETLLKNIQAEDDSVRAEATASLGPAGAEVVGPLARVLEGESPAVIRAVRTALETIGHHAARPGASEEREKVAEAFAAACSVAKKPGAKNVLLEILSFVGTAQVVSVVAEALDVPETHDAACLALARIEGPESAEVLRNALSAGASREDSQQIALLNALGAKNDITAAYLLSDLAGSASSDEVYLAALEALSRNSMAYGYVHVYWDAMPPGDSEEQRRMRSRVWDCLLRVGEAFIGAGEVGAASDLYCELLDNVSNTAEKCGVITGLGASGRRDAPGRVFEALEDEDPEVRATVLTALETLRLGGFYVGIGPALEQADAPLKVGILRVLGYRTEPQAGPLIVSCLDHEELDVRVAALGAAEKNGSLEVAKALIESVVKGQEVAREGALGALGRMPGEEITAAIVEVARSAKAELRVSLLRALVTRGDSGAREFIIESARADDEAVRVAAYGGLGALKPTDALPALLSGIDRGGDDAVAAEKALTGLPLSEIREALAEAARRRSGEARACVVRVLGRHQDSHVIGLLLEAADDDSESVRIAAIEGLSRQRDARVLPVLLEAATEGPERVRTDALLGCLSFGKTIEKGSRDTALTVYHTALKVGGSAERLEALDGIGRLADPRSIDILTPLLKAGDTRSAAAAALLAVAVKLGDDRKDEAIKLLKSTLPLAPASLAAPAAVARLRSLGVDYDIARDSGFVTRWWLLGPFPDPQGKMLGGDLVDPETVRGGEGKTVEVGDRELPWKFHHTADPRGAVDLHAAVAPRDQVGAYAYTEVTVPEMRRITLKFGSDDSIVCWLNGKKLHTFGGVRGLTVDQDQVAAKLESGKNRILLKVLNQAGGWAFCLRITDRTGVPLVFGDGRK